MTANDPCLNILKQAILLERKGREFYTVAAEKAGAAEVALFFQTMAREETHHIEILGTQFKHYQEHGCFIRQELPAAEAADTVLTPELMAQIAAAGFEAAAISAAMAMEERAIQLYTERARRAGDPAEKEIYTWLSAWEQKHLAALARLDRQLTERIWNDNSYWPF